MISIIAGWASGMSSKTIGETSFQSISLVAPGAFMVGFAATIKVILEEASIGDTIAYELAQSLNGALALWIRPRNVIGAVID